MKKISKYTIAAGILIALIGLIWCGFNWRRINHDVQHLSHKDYVTKQTSFASDPVRNIKFNTDGVAVAIKTQPDLTHAKVVYSGTHIDDFKVASSGNTISVSRASDGADWKSGFCLWHCIGAPQTTATVYVPANSAYAYDMMAQNGNVMLSGTLRAEKVHVASSNSSVKLSDTTTSGGIDLRSENGSILLQNVTSAGALGLNSSNASNTLTHVQALSIKSKTDNGSARLSAVTTKDLTVTSSNAAITLDRLSADRSTLTSNNGNIKGSVLGAQSNYDTKIDNKNGNVIVDGKKYGATYFSGKGSLPRSLTAHASNATIDISFVK